MQLPSGFKCAGNTIKVELVEKQIIIIMEIGAMLPIL